ncbi:hypothetical protein PI124_g4118 [Phytophthora idaei]|nr:hypothetical protein PI125_g2739 [Phytophthora idaei]KAG3166020.1 hypothetical protein PI126_g4389 [Phytophthora idaei]KAG3251259.1 hypothetical protein PI124_g4118 [Phytophthora idaei]
MLLAVVEDMVTRSQCPRTLVESFMLLGLGWLEDGRLLVVSMNKRRVLAHNEKTSTEVYADVKARTNDMVVAQSGRSYIESFGFNMANDTAYSRSVVISVGARALSKRGI